MVVERRLQLDNLLPEEITIGPELANAPHHRVLEEAFLEFDTGVNGVEFEELLEEWGGKILSWWSFNIRSGTIKTEYVGDETDGQWICTYTADGENAELKLGLANGFVDSPRLKSKVKNEVVDDIDWEVDFNNNWVERIKKTTYEEDPESKMASTRKILEIYHPIPLFLTKPAPQTP